nr:zinc ribbon domain-containing protein [Halorubrum ezzemoulense]
MSIERLSHTAGEYGITVEMRSEADTIRTCPAYGEQDDTDRDSDVFRCPCSHEAHADLCASRTFLEQQADEIEAGSIVRPVRLRWDDHNWSGVSHSPERASRNEERTNRSPDDGKLASVGSA